MILFKSLSFGILKKNHIYLTNYKINFLNEIEIHVCFVCFTACKSSLIKRLVVNSLLEK